MATLPLNQALARFVTNENRYDVFINGDKEAVYTTPDAIHVPSVRNFLHGLEAAVSAGLSVFQSVEALEGTIVSPDITTVLVVGPEGTAHKRVAAGTAQPDCPASARSRSADGRWWVVSEAILRPEFFLYSGGVSQSGNAAIQDMFDFASDGDFILMTGQYAISSSNVCGKQLFIDASSAEFIVSENITPFVFEAPTVGVFGLSADYGGGRTLEVSGNSTAPGDGEPIKIVSNAVDPKNRDTGSNATKYRVGEWAVCSQGSTATSFILSGDLEFSVGISPTSISGDEPEVAAYTVAMNARVVRLSGKTLEWRGGKITYTGIQSTWTAPAFSVIGYVRPKLALRFGTIPESGISVKGCYAPTIEYVECEEFGAATDGQSGYLVANSSYGLTVENMVSMRGRHAYTTTGPTSPANTTTTSALLSLGRTCDAVVKRGLSRGAGSLDLPMYDTHHDAERSQLIDCQVIGGSGPAFTARGRGTKFVRPVAVDRGEGLFALTEYSNEEPDDDLFLNSKALYALTECSLYDADFSVDTRVIEFRESIGLVEGTGKYKTKAHNCLTFSGTTEFTGDHLVTINGDMGTSGAACVTVNAPNSRHVAAFSGLPSLLISGNLTVDARATTVTGVVGVSVALGASLIVRGRLRLLLPATATAVLSGSGSITCEEGGVIEYSVEGRGDWDIAVGQSRAGLRIRSLDGSVDWDTATGSLRTVSFSGSLAVEHAGTGALVKNVFIPKGQSASSFMNTNAPALLRVTISGQKSGYVGTGSIYLYSGTDNYVVNFDFPASASGSQVNFLFVAEVYFTSPGNQLHVTSLSSTVSGTGVDVTHSNVRSEAAPYSGADDKAVRIGADIAVGDTLRIMSCRVETTAGGVLGSV